MFNNNKMEFPGTSRSREEAEIRMISTGPLVKFMDLKTSFISLMSNSRQLQETQSLSKMLLTKLSQLANITPQLKIHSEAI